MEETYLELIQRAIPDINHLAAFWDRLKQGEEPDGWLNLNQKGQKVKSGKAFEYFILRAFELEGCEVTWPYAVIHEGLELEQIDGHIYIKDGSYNILCESKHESANIGIGPVAKLRNQLIRRANLAVGCIFTVTGFTEPAETLANFIEQQSVLFWTGDEIEFCIHNSTIDQPFTNGMKQKIKYATTHGFCNFDLTTA